MSDLLFVLVGFDVDSFKNTLEPLEADVIVEENIRGQFQSLLDVLVLRHKIIIFFLITVIQSTDPPSQQLFGNIDGCVFINCLFVPSLESGGDWTFLIAYLLIIEFQNWNYFISPNHYHFVSFLRLLNCDIPERYFLKSSFLL